MKREADEGDAYLSPYPVELYPYGTRLCLTSEQCEALGLTAAIKAGTKVKLSGLAIVVSSREGFEQGEPGKVFQLDLQITDLGIESQGMVRDAAQVLYGGTTSEDD